MQNIHFTSSSNWILFNIKCGSRLRDMWPFCLIRPQWWLNVTFCIVTVFLSSDCVSEKLIFPLVILLCSKLLPTTRVTCCIMGWPELPCCGIFCNCDEEVTQMLNWTLMCKYCFRWTLCGMIRHSAVVAVTHREWCPSRKAPTYIWVTSSCSPPLSLERSPNSPPTLMDKGRGSTSKPRCQKNRILQTLMSVLLILLLFIKGLRGNEVLLTYSH